MCPRLPLTNAAQGAGALNPKPNTVLSGRPPSASTYSATMRASGARPLAPIATPRVSRTICLISSTSSRGSTSYASDAALSETRRVTPVPSSRAILFSRLGRDRHLVALDRKAVREALRGPFHVTQHVGETRIGRLQDFRTQVPVDDDRQKRRAGRRRLRHHGLCDKAAFRVGAVRKVRIVGIENDTIAGTELCRGFFGFGGRRHDEVAEAVKARIPSVHTDRLGDMRVMPQ